MQCSVVQCRLLFVRINSLKYVVSYCDYLNILVDKATELHYPIWVRISEPPTAILLVFETSFLTHQRDCFPKVTYQIFDRRISRYICLQVSPSDNIKEFVKIQEGNKKLCQQPTYLVYQYPKYLCSLSKFVLQD